MQCEKCGKLNDVMRAKCVACSDVLTTSKAGVLSRLTNQRLAVYMLIFIAIVLGLYSGIYLLAMLVIFLITFWLRKYLLDPKTLHYAPTIAIQASLVIVTGTFFTLSILLNNSVFNALFVLIDIAFPVVCLFWLIEKRSLKPVLLLGIFQLIALTTHFIDIAQMDFASRGHRIYVNYAFWRIAALYFLWAAYSQSRTNNGKLSS
jgi:hypothetical protein